MGKEATKKAEDEITVKYLKLKLLSFLMLIDFASSSWAWFLPSCDPSAVFTRGPRRMGYGHFLLHDKRC